MVKLAVLNDLNLFDSIQVQINSQGGVSQEQRTILENQPSLIASMLKRIWSNISLMGIYLIGLVFLAAFEVDRMVMIIYTVVVILLVIGLVGLAELPIHRKREQILDDIAASRVRNADGTIIFRDQALQADIGDRLLILPRAGSRLMPGIMYRFFYLEESGVVLSAEKKDSPGDVSERQSYQEILLQANQFNSEALPENRKGRLSHPHQLKHFIGNIITGSLVILGFGGISWYFLSIYLASLSSADGASILSLICASGSVLIGITGLFTFGRALIDLLRGKVMTVSGIGRKAARIARRRTFMGKTQEENPIAFYYEIGEMLFKVSEPASNVFINDVRYAAYYTPLSKTLVGIEPLESPSRSSSTT